MLKEHEQQLRAGGLIRLDERGEIFRIHLMRRSIEQRRDTAEQVLRDTGLTVFQNSVSWNEEDPRFQDPAFAPRLYGLIRQHQQTLEEIALLNLAVRRAEEWGKSRRFALYAMPGILRDFQLSIVPVMEYNLLRMLHLDDVAMAMVAGLTSATTSLHRSPRLSRALRTKQREEGGGDLRVKLREELLSAIADLPHVGNQIEITPEGFTQFLDLKNKVTRDLFVPPDDPLSDVENGEGGVDPLETLMAVEGAQEYQDRFTRFSAILSPREREMVEVVRQLEEEKGAGNFRDQEIAERLGIPTHNIPNMRKHMAKKLKRIA